MNEIGDCAVLYPLCYRAICVLCAVRAHCMRLNIPYTNIISPILLACTVECVCVVKQYDSSGGGNVTGP